MKVCLRNLPTNAVCGEAIPCRHHGKEFASDEPPKATVVMLNDSPFAIVFEKDEKAAERALEVARAAAEAYVRRNGWSLPDDARKDLGGGIRQIVYLHTKAVPVYPASLGT